MKWAGLLCRLQGRSGGENTEHRLQRDRSGSAAGEGRGPHSQVIKEFGLHSKDCMAPKEGLVPAEVCSDVGFRELLGPECVDGRTGLGGRGMVRCPTRRSGLEEGPCERGGSWAQYSWFGPHTLGMASVAPCPTPHSHWLPGKLASSPEVGEFPQLPPCWAQTCSP